MRNSIVKSFALGMIAGSFLTAGTLAFAFPVKADGYLDAMEADYADTYGATAICPVIDEYHSPAGVMGVAKGIMADGFTPDSAVDVLNYAVETYCPRNFPLLQAIGRAARGETGQTA